MCDCACVRVCGICHQELERVVTLSGYVYYQCRNYCRRYTVKDLDEAPLRPRR